VLSIATLDIEDDAELEFERRLVTAAEDDGIELIVVVTAPTALVVEVEVIELSALSDAVDSAAAGLADGKPPYGVIVTGRAVMVVT
jgi:hypothetical protein